MKMNFQSETITLATSNLFFNLPKLELLFNDELIHKIIMERQRKKLKKRNQEIKRIRMKRGSEISSSTKHLSESYIPLNEDNDLVVVNMVSDKQKEMPFEDFIDDEIPPFVSRFFVSIPSIVIINLINSNFQTISTLHLEDLTYDYLNDIDGTIKQSIIVRNFTMLNKLPSARDQNGNPNRYYTFLTPLDPVTSYNPFFTMNIHQIGHTMKMPFFNKIQIVLLPVELSIYQKILSIRLYLILNFLLNIMYLILIKC